MVREPNGLLDINPWHAFDVAQQLVGDGAGLLGHLVDVDLFAPAFDWAADACLGQVAEVDGEHIHRYPTDGTGDDSTDCDGCAGWGYPGVTICIAYGD